MKDQKAFVLHPADNVGTALDDLEPGPVMLIGEHPELTTTCREPVKFGHKIALQDIEQGSFVTKNNVVIGKAYKAIKKGQMVHLHNVESLVDERAGTLDVETGVPKDKDVYQ